MIDGVTGFIVDNVPDAVKAVGRIDTISRRACRRTFADRYDAARMTRDYLDVYRKLTIGQDRTHPPINHASCVRRSAGLLGPVVTEGPRVAP